MTLIYLVCIAFVVLGIGAGIVDLSSHLRRQREGEAWLQRPGILGAVADFRFEGSGRSRVETVTFTADSGAAIRSRPTWRDTVALDREGQQVEVWHHGEKPQRLIALLDRDVLARGRRFPYLTVVAGPVVGILAAVLIFALVPDIMRGAGLL